MHSGARHYSSRNDSRNELRVMKRRPAAFFHPMCLARSDFVLRQRINCEHFLLDVQIDHDPLAFSQEFGRSLIENKLLLLAGRDPRESR